MLLRGHCPTFLQPLCPGNQPESPDYRHICSSSVAPLGDSLGWCFPCSNPDQVQSHCVLVRRAPANASLFIFVESGAAVCEFFLKAACGKGKRPQFPTVLLGAHYPPSVAEGLGAIRLSLLSAVSLDKWVQVRKKQDLQGPQNQNTGSMGHEFSTEPWDLPESSAG